MPQAFLETGKNVFCEVYVMEAAKLESTPTPDEVSRESQQCDQNICSEKPQIGDQNGLEKQQSNDQNGIEKRLKVSSRRSASNLEEIPR